MELLGPLAGEAEEKEAERAVHDIVAMEALAKKAALKVTEPPRVNADKPSKPKLVIARLSHPSLVGGAQSARAARERVTALAQKLQLHSKPLQPLHTLAHGLAPRYPPPVQAVADRLQHERQVAAHPGLQALADGDAVAPSFYHTRKVAHEVLQSGQVSLQDVDEHKLAAYIEALPAPADRKAAAFRRKGHRNEQGENVGLLEATFSPLAHGAGPFEDSFRAPAVDENSQSCN